MSKSCKIVLAEPLALVRQGLASLLSTDGREVVGQAGTAAGALEQIRAHRPDLFIFDLALPDQPALDMVRKARRLTPELAMIALLGTGSGSTRRVVEAGVKGLVNKSCDCGHLDRAVEAVLQGQTYIARADDQIDRPAADKDHRDLGLLSQRERQVLKLVAEGYSTKDVSAQLSVSVKTVDTHRQHIMDKLNIRGIADLTRFAIREGLSPLS